MLSIRLRFDRKRNKFPDTGENIVIRTFQQLFSKVPNGWWDAYVVFQDRRSNCHESSPIVELSLREDSDGRRVIVFHEISIDVPQSDADSEDDKLENMTSMDVLK